MTVTIYRGFSSPSERGRALSTGLTPLQPLLAESPVSTLDDASVLTVFSPNDVISHVYDEPNKKKRFVSFSTDRARAVYFATHSEDGSRHSGFVVTADLDLRPVGGTIGGAPPHVYRDQFGSYWIDPKVVAPTDPSHSCVGVAYCQTTDKALRKRYDQLIMMFPTVRHNAERDSELLLAEGAVVFAAGGVTPVQT